MGTDCGDEYGGVKEQEDLLQDSYGTRQVFSCDCIHGRGRETQLLLGESQKIKTLNYDYYISGCFCFVSVFALIRLLFYAITKKIMLTIMN